MYAGAAHADSSEYQPCIALWNYALQLKIHKEATAPVAIPNKLLLAFFFLIFQVLVFKLM
jgi:hypothetical protein